MSNEFIANQLARLPPDRALTIKGDKAWIRCPWHKAGQEKTPSLSINLNNGGFICFGCQPSQNGKTNSGNWHKLAVKLQLKKGDADDILYPTEMSLSESNSLLGEDDDLNEKRQLVLRSPRFEKIGKWRGIQGWLLYAIRARVVFNEFGSQVYLPIKVNGEWYSGIYCSWTKTKSSYIYDGDTRVNQAWFPYDYVKREIRKLPARKRYVVLVEGPRDALNLLQNDILALAHLGGSSVWNEDRAELVLNLNPYLILLAFDPDKVGYALRRLAVKYYHGKVAKLLKFKMKPENKAIGRDKEDPGNLTDSRLRYLKRKIHEALTLL